MRAEDRSSDPNTDAEPPAAVLWDMDGTLVDSEKVWSISLAETARWLGGELSPEAREAMIGSNMAANCSIPPAGKSVRFSMRLSRVMVSAM